MWHKYTSTYELGIDWISPTTRGFFQKYNGGIPHLWPCEQGFFSWKMNGKPLDLDQKHEI